MSSETYLSPQRQCITHMFSSKKHDQKPWPSIVSLILLAIPNSVPFFGLHNSSLFHLSLFPFPQLSDYFAPNNVFALSRQHGFQFLIKITVFPIQNLELTVKLRTVTSLRKCEKLFRHLAIYPQGDKTSLYAKGVLTETNLNQYGLPISFTALFHLHAKWSNHFTC